MKVLQVNCVYGHGSTGKIVNDMHNVLLKKNHSSVVCFGRQRTKFNKQPYVYKFCTELESKMHNIAHRYFGVLAFGGCSISTNKLFGIIKKEKPDIVHLHCINGYSVNIFNLLSWLAVNKVKTVVTNHAEFFYTGNCGHAYDCNKWMADPGCGECPILCEATGGSRYIDYTARSWKKMKDSFNNFATDDLLCTAVSPWVKGRFLESPITKQFRCEVIMNGLDTTVFKRANKERRMAIRESLGIKEDEKMVFHATAFFYLDENNLKGGRYILELANRIPDVIFVVAALEYEIIPNCPKNLKLIGAAKDQANLAELYSSADLTVVVSRRETFSMIVAESLCCGTPIIGFKAGGPESIALEEYSEFVDYDDVDALENALNKYLACNVDYDLLAARAQKEYSKEAMTDGYIACYEQLLLK